MSKKKAKAESLGGETETYPTPAWCVHRLLDDVHLPGGRWLEPCAGEGGIIKAVSARAFGPSLGIDWTACDIREEARHDLVELRSMGLIGAGERSIITGDFLTSDVDNRAARASYHRWPYDVVLTNPPYSLAEAFIAKCRTLAPIVVMLLRVNYLASATRQPMHRVDLPEYLWVLPDRPKFKNGGSDSCEYAWFIWTQVKTPEARLRILNATPLDERRIQEGSGSRAWARARRLAKHHEHEEEHADL